MTEVRSVTDVVLRKQRDGCNVTDIGIVQSETCPHYGDRQKTYPMRKRERDGST